MGIFRKNKRQFGICSHRRVFVALFLFLIFGISASVSFILRTNAQTVPIRSVEITSSHTSYEDAEPGAWKITKSAEWTDVGKARVTFEVDSIPKYDESKNLDVLMVIDRSDSMKGRKMEQVKSDATELIDYLLSRQANRVALVTFENSATVLSGFTNDKDRIISLINSISPTNTTDYYQGLLKAEEVLEGYEQQNDRDLILLFLTDGYPNTSMPNEISQYRTLKAKYPYMVINGIQYEMGDAILQPIIDISDKQYVADVYSLENVLFDVVAKPYYYEDFIITDYIDDRYWTIIDAEAINTSLGETKLEYDNTTPKIIWDIGGSYKTGSKAILTIDIEPNAAALSAINSNPDNLLFLPTNTHETINVKLKDTSNEDIDSDKTPILKSGYIVNYDANAPDGCEIADTDIPASAMHLIYSAVEISDTVLTCPGYVFKGWQPVIPTSTVINDDYFRMPEDDVYIKAIWAKLSISKSMDGTTHHKATATFNNGSNVNTRLKVLSGQTGVFTNTTNTTITDIKKADTLSPDVIFDDDYYILSDDSSEVPIYGWYDEGVIYYYTEADETYLHEDSNNMFRELRALTSLSAANEWKTSNVTNMDSMFSAAGYSANTFNLDLSGWDTSNVTSMYSAFYQAGYSASDFELDLSGWNTSKVTDIGHLFANAGYNATSWTVGDLSEWDTSNVESMGYTFSNAGYNASTFDVSFISNWDTSNVSYMSRMFNGAGRNATNWSVGDLSGWNTSKVTDMSYMFSLAGVSVNSFSLDLSSWDTSSVVRMGHMFESAGNNTNSFSLNLSGWNTEKVTSMEYMFANAGRNALNWSVEGISGWNTGKVTNMNQTFYSAGYKANTFSLNLSNWNTSNVTSMGAMFASAGYSATSWSVGDLSGWNTEKVTTMANMFSSAGYSATSWSVGDLSGWNTEKVTTMNGMFSSAGYSATSWSVGDLSGWNTSIVTAMNNMFNQAGYNDASWSVGDLSGWNTEKVTSMENMFREAGYHNNTFSLDLSGWNTSKVTNMSNLFAYAGYNATSWSVGDLSGWDTSNVINMSQLFFYAGYNIDTFSLDLSRWNTLKVTNMNYMFQDAGYNARTFSLDLSGWNTSKVSNMKAMFNSAGYNASNWTITIPETNGNNIPNTTSTMYGSATYTYATLQYNRTFTLAPTPSDP